MDAREQLQQHIDEQQGRLAAGVLSDREAALLALVQAIDAGQEGEHPEPDLVSGRWNPALGALTALRLCLEAPATSVSVADSAAWARGFLERCRDLDSARLVARHAGSGEMRVAANGEEGFDTWHAGHRPPATWRERADIAWWARRLALMETVPQAGSTAESIVWRMGYQLPYPAGAEVGGVPVSVIKGALAILIDWVAEPGAAVAQLVVDERALLGVFARRLNVSDGLASRVMAALTLDGDNAGWHAALPGGPLAPLVRVGAERLACSRLGLFSEPGFFALRELRRRDPEGYHNAAHLREHAFRDDLYDCFADRRFVTSPDRIVLRRGDRRNRTDVDAAVFDRKSGTLAVFELKSQDPLARTQAEQDRQQENLRRAGHQMAAVLDWIARNGADEVLSRMDRGASKRFRVQRVVAFVLGRYAGEPGAAERNGRVAWGSWPRFLRAMDDASGSNPMVGSHARLLGDEPSLWDVPADASPVDIPVGPTRVTVWPSWSTLQASWQRNT